MQKAQAENEIRSLISQWCQQEPQRQTNKDNLHCSDFIKWLRENSPGHLDFFPKTNRLLIEEVGEFTL